MKRFILFIAFLLCFNSAYASDNVSFIYINGSNNNDEKMKTWYQEGVHKLHPVLKKNFETNATIKHHYKAQETLNISEEPIIFFWGDKSEHELAFVKDQLDISKAISSSGAFFARNLIAEYMHDAIWIQKQHNMLPILDELNEIVKEETAKGKDVILYGYSAGTFVTYEYLFNKMRYINLQDLFTTLKMDDEFLEFVKENPRKNTCVSALSYSKGGIGSFSQAGHIILNQDKEKLKENYLLIDSKTELYCAPEGFENNFSVSHEGIINDESSLENNTSKKGHVRGVVNFASPLVLFYSDLSDSDYEVNYYNKLMTKYIFENGVFWLTINFREDPLGFPTTRNLTLSEIEDRLGMEINNPSGIIFDNSSVWSKRFFALAHTSYWSARKTFSKAIVNSFINGYKFQYDPKYQDKVLKRNSKKYEL